MWSGCALGRYGPTGPRRAILDAIAACDGLFDHEVLVIVREARGEASSRATICRLLGRLYTSGWLLPYHIATDNGFGLSRSRRAPYPCPPLAGLLQRDLRGVGRIHFIKRERIAASIALLLAEVGFAMREHRPELYGSYGKCGAAHSSATATSTG